MDAVSTRALTGVVLLVLFGAWALLADPSAPQGIAWAASCALLGLGLVSGLVAGRHHPAVPGLFALAVAVGAVAVTLPGSLSGLPNAPPLGYLNANGALLVCGAAGAVVASIGRERVWVHRAAGVAAVLCVVCALNGGKASAYACAGLVAWALLRHRGTTPQWVAVGVATVSVPMLLTLGWAAQVLPRPRPVVEELSAERFALWREAWLLLGDHPWTGVGPGRFSQGSQSAAADPDLSWAHSTLLQTGAELGWVGIGLLVALLVWGLVALGRDGVLLGIVMLPASVDYVLHFGGVLLLSSVVVGGALVVSGSGKPTLTPPSP